MRRIFTILFLLVCLLVSGCQPAARSDTPGSGTPSSVTPASTAVVSQPPATTAPTGPTPLSGQATSSPAPAPAVVRTTIPETNWQAWDVYESALRPEARGGLELSGMTQYHLMLDLPDDLKTLNGTVYIHYTNRSKDTLDRVYLHLFPNLWDAGLVVSDVQVGGQAAATSLEQGGALLLVNLPQPLAPGQVVDLAMKLTVPIPAGSDVGNYGEFAFRDGVLALAHVYPTMVVYDDRWHLERPSQQGDVIFHQASLYEVVLTAPAKMTVVATGATAGRTAQADGRTTWHLVGGPMRDFNIVASERYQKASQQVGDVVVNSYFSPEHASGGQKALGWATTALSTYETDFGAYPYTELDLVETTTSAGGVEYPGLVVVSGDLYQDQGRADFFESATVHEVAHQWWYNTVGNDQVNNPWLDEALAQYTTYRYYQKAYGPGGAEGFAASLRSRWARVNNEDIPIGLPVSAYEGREYGAIVYGRGPLFLLAVQDKIGEEGMLKFLRQYYQKYDWQIVTPADFQNTLQQVSGQDLSALFNQWVYPAK